MKENPVPCEVASFLGKVQRLSFLLYRFYDWPDQRGARCAIRKERRARLVHVTRLEDHTNGSFPWRNCARNLVFENVWMELDKCFEKRDTKLMVVSRKQWKRMTYVNARIGLRCVARSRLCFSVLLTSYVRIFKVGHLSIRATTSWERVARWRHYTVKTEHVTYRKLTYKAARIHMQTPPSFLRLKIKLLSCLRSRFLGSDVEA